MAPKRRRQDKAQSKGDVVTQKRIKLQHRDNTTATAKITSTSAQDSTSNTTQPAQSAAAQAFATTELLEQILLAVDDIKSLLLMRRVAPQWRTFIDETSSLKNKMWLVPQQLDHEEHEWYLSPGAIYLHKRPRTTDAAAVAGSGDVIYRGTYRPIWRSEFHSTWISQPLFIRKQAKPSLLKTRSIFLKMFATQPPVPVMYLRVRNGDNELRNYRCLVERVKNSKGEAMLIVEEMMFPLEQESEIEARPYRGFIFGE
ncbi:hypothetical protein MBLNU13_g07143t1 [Cladosporium sp. NU13]